MATLGSILPWYGGYWSLNDGTPAAGYKVFFFSAGSTTHQTTYSDANLTTPNTNPVTLDSAGRADIFLSANTYDIYLATPTASDPPVGAQIIKTALAVSASTSLTSVNIPIVAGESIVAGQWIYESKGSGGLTAGRWYLTDSDNVYSSVLARQIAVSNSSLSVSESGSATQSGRYVLLSGSVVAGSEYFLSATAGAITTTPPSPNARRVAIADTTTSVLISFSQSAGFFTGVLPGGINTTTVGNVGAGEDDLMSFTLDTLLFGASGTYQFECFGTTAANANTKRIRAYVDGVLWYDSTALALNAEGWLVRITVMIRTQLSNGTTGMVEFVVTTAAGAGYSVVTTFNAATVVGSCIVKLTGESVSVPATDDVVQYAMISKQLA